jgi:RNA polymerase sigma-70 factor (ECF subfamily)
METSAAVRDADREAIDALSRQFRPALLRYFARRGISAADLEDVAQEVFVRLSGRAAFAEVRRRDAYLFETAAHVAIDHHRRATVRQRAAHHAYDDTTHALSELSPERLHAGQEELQLLVVALREMPERMRDVFILTRLESIPQAQVARQLRISLSAVEKNLVKAIAYLSARLEREP